MPATLDPPAPFAPLDPIDLGTRFRGDTVPFTLTLTDDSGAAVDLSGRPDIWSTFKEDLSLDDLEGNGFQLSTLSTGVAILDPPTAGRVTFTIPPTATVNLENDTLFAWDVQVKIGVAITTRARGVLLFVLDVTRAIS